jgi:hypothetical protein
MLIASRQRHASHDRREKDGGEAGGRQEEGERAHGNLDCKRTHIVSDSQTRGAALGFRLENINPGLWRKRQGRHGEEAGRALGRRVRGNPASLQRRGVVHKSGEGRTARWGACETPRSI